MDSVFKDHRGSHDEAQKASMRQEIASQLEGTVDEDACETSQIKLGREHKEFAA